MAKTKRQIKNFILKTLLPYKEDRNNCASDGTFCEYLSSDGQKCAVGRWMKKGSWQDHIGDYRGLCKSYLPSEFFLKPALDMGFDEQEWIFMQNYHDLIALNYGKEWINKAVRKLENKFGIKLTELLVTEI